MAAENENDGLLAAEGRKGHFGGAVGGHEMKIRGGIADTQSSLARLEPEGLERENEESQRRHVRHHAVED